jgi:GTP cyclohydrolase II
MTFPAFGRRCAVFSYVDPKIQGMLEAEGRLVHVDRDGGTLAPGEGAPYLSMLGPIPLPRLVAGEERKIAWYPFVRRVELGAVCAAACGVRDKGSDALRDLLHSNMSVNSVLATEGFLEAAAPLVRIHSCCMTGDVFGSMRCECGPQLEAAFERIVREGEGAVVYMSGHEGRGIGLWAKAVTYILQDAGQDTYQANTSLGLPEDSRDFTDAAVALRHLLGGRPVRLLSNNPLKREHLEAAGQPVAAMVPHVAGVGAHNVRYLRSKRDKGHTLPEL